MALHVRLATAADIPAINAIYNYYVVHSTATFQTEPATLEEREAWLAEHGEKHPVIVVEGDLPMSSCPPPRMGADSPLAEVVERELLVAAGEGAGGRPPAILGWGSLSRFHGRCAFRFTVEDSVYVHPLHLRQGLGKVILADLIGRAKGAGHHAILGVICAEQGASVEIHRRMGFELMGTTREVGWKFQRWLDVAYMELLV